MNPTVCQNSLPFHPDRRISARFDGGKITSDAGLLLFYALDKQTGSAKASAAAWATPEKKRTSYWRWFANPDCGRLRLQRRRHSARRSVKRIGSPTPTPIWSQPTFDLVSRTPWVSRT